MSFDMSAHIAELNELWGNRLPLFASGAFSDKGEIALLPHLLAPAFSPIDRAKLNKLSVASCLFSDAVLLCDDVIDYAATDSSTAKDLPKAVALFMESYRIFGEVLWDRPAFWGRLRSYIGDYLDAMDREARLSSGVLSWRDCRQEGCIEIVRGKNGLVRTVSAAIGEFGNDILKADVAGELLLNYFVACQMLDDLRDWREDVRNGSMSLLLLRVSAERPEVANVEHIGRCIFGNGHAEYVLTLGIEVLERTMRDASRLKLEEFAAVVNRRRHQMLELKGNIEGQLHAVRITSGQGSA